MSAIQAKIGDDGELIQDVQNIKSLNKITVRVRDILAKYPETRGDDVLLVWRFYREYYSHKIRFSFKQFKDLLEIPAMESITRARRSIQKPSNPDAGEFKPSEKKRRKRVRREGVMRQYFKGENHEQ